MTIEQARRLFANSDNMFKAGVRLRLGPPLPRAISEAEFIKAVRDERDGRPPP